MWLVVTILSGISVADDSIEVDADQIVLQESSVVAVGSVSVQRAAHTVRADSVSFEHNAGGQLSFSGSNVRWTPCTCDVAPWSISADEAQGTVDQHVILRDAALELCETRILPIPRIRVPLRPRSPKVLFPEFGHGRYGGRIGTPVWFPAGEEGQWVVTPELRYSQALRQKVAFSDRVGTAGGAIAREFESGTVRWDGHARGGVDDGGVRLGISSQWVSDQTVFEDYGTDFTDRSTPFAEQLMVGAAGPVRLESNTFNTGWIQRPIGAVVSFAGENIGAVVLDAETRIDWIELGNDAADMQRAYGRFAMGNGRRIGLTETRVQAEVRALQESDGQPWTQGHVEGGWYVPMWGRVGDLVHLAEVGMEAALAHQDGVLRDRLDWIREAPSWSYGPTLRSTFVGPGGVPASSVVGVRQSAEGWEPTFTGNLNRKNVSGRIQADPQLQAVRVGFSDEIVQSNVGAVRDDQVMQSFGDMSMTITSQWRPGIFGLYDHGTQTWVRYGPLVHWDSGCDCLAMNIGMEWAQDREYPDAWIRLDLRSGRLRDSE